MSTRERSSRGRAHGYSSDVVPPAPLTSLSDWLLRLPRWVALAFVFLVPALEASAFVGFVFPGEIAVIVGGVLAFQGRFPLWAAMAAGILGAVIGDSVGYLVGERWGRSLLHGTLGHLPLIHRELDKNLDRAEAYVRRRKGSAVFFGRFTAALRVLVPGLAGMSGVHYPSFLAYNAAGGILWGGGFTLLGYLAGASYHRVERIASRAGLILLGLAVIVLAAAWVLRSVRNRSSRTRRLLDRAGNSSLVALVRGRLPRQVAWLGRRLDPSSPRGIPLSFAVMVAALCAWAFGGLTQDVIAHDDTALRDPAVQAFVIAHRSGALTGAMKSVTWLGSLAVLAPLVLAVGGLFLIRSRNWRPGLKLAVALGGAIAWSDLAKVLVERQRPPASVWIGQYPGWAYPSGHATQAIATWGMLAVVVSAGRAPRTRAWLWATATLLALMVGISRVYLGAHWLTDVLGGWALGACWLAIVVAASLWMGGSAPAGEAHIATTERLRREKPRAA